MTDFFELEGQRVVYNRETKIVKTTIDEPFFKASKILGWQTQSPGLGLNFSIINFVLKTQSRLVVHVKSAGHDYWITWDKIKQLLHSINCDYRVNNSKWLKVLPWREFVGYRHHEVAV